jgi:hypothetical protein
MSKPITHPHPCPGGCGTDVEHSKLACRSCWWLLPKDLRNRITRNHRRNRTEHAHAVAEAVTWYAENVRDGTPL